jgi:hypothetical protein
MSSMPLVGRAALARCSEYPSVNCPPPPSGGHHVDATLHQTVVDCVCSRVSFAACVDLAVQIGDVPLDGVHAQDQLRSDLLVALAAGDQPQNQTPSGNASMRLVATSSASWVLPLPPVPVSVTSRPGALSVRPRTVAASCSRPNSRLCGAARLWFGPAGSRHSVAARGGMAQRRTTGRHAPSAS